MKQFKVKNLNKVQKLILAVFLGFLIFGLVFLVINSPAYYLRTKYFFKKGEFNQIVKEFGNDKLIIKKINVNAPIIWDVAENEVNRRLSEGVIHYQGTAHPDEKGNVFLTAHSSYYLWSDSPYKAVFALLDKLEKNDEVLITYHDKIFVYKVYETQIVSPQEVSILEQTNESIVTLMTCVPIGTDLNRLVVRAKLVYSKPF